MSWTRVIVLVNVALYIMQFLFGKYSKYLFVGIIFLNLLAGLMSYALENKELSKAFLLSAVVVTLIGPVIIVSGVMIAGVLCFGSMCMAHH